jgi:hypothetical protein
MQMSDRRRRRRSLVLQLQRIRMQTLVQLHNQQWRAVVRLVVELNVQTSLQLYPNHNGARNDRIREMPRQEQPQANALKQIMPPLTEAF